MSHAASTRHFLGLLQLGFRDQVAQIMAALHSPQLLLFSATVPPETERFARKLLTRPVYVAVGQPGVVATSVRQVSNTSQWLGRKCVLLPLRLNSIPLANSCQGHQINHSSDYSLFEIIPLNQLAFAHAPLPRILTNVA